MNYYAKAIVEDGHHRITELTASPNFAARELFKTFHDFSPTSHNSNRVDEHFRNGDTYGWQNGDYTVFNIIAQGLDVVFGALNAMPGVSVPSKPDELGSRAHLLKSLIEITVKIYKLSSLTEIIGDNVLCLGIWPDQTYLPS